MALALALEAALSYFFVGLPGLLVLVEGRVVGLEVGLVVGREDGREDGRDDGRDRLLDDLDLATASEGPKESEEIPIPKVRLQARRAIVSFFILLFLK